MNHTIVHVEIPAKDRHAASKFYEGLFGWGSISHMDEYMYSTFFAGNGGGGFAELGENRKPGDVVFYVFCEDLDADLKAAEANGAVITVPKMPIPNGEIAWIADPTGNNIGLMCWTESLNEEPKPSGRPFAHVEIPANDRDVMAKFYQKLFGWNFQHIPEFSYTTFEAPTFGGGFPDVDDTYKPGDIIVYIDSDDLKADGERIKAAGGSLMGDPMDVPGFGSFQMWTDPTGNRLALWHSTNP